MSAPWTAAGAAVGAGMSAQLQAELSEIRAQQQRAAFGDYLGMSSRVATYGTQQQSFGRAGELRPETPAERTAHASEDTLLERDRCIQIALDYAMRAVPRGDIQAMRAARCVADEIRGGTE